ncbi:MAG: hypothetical protein JWO30_3028 [Fibrobacteres bacterium]|nr:hypothetical protein [Fibrobacterota bacterium]
MDLRFPTYCLAAALAAVSVFATDVAYRISGQGWAEYGRVAHATDTLLVNMNGNALQSAGAQFTAYADIGENWEGAFGIGGFQVHHMQGGSGVSSRSMQFYFRNFITESRMTYFRGGKADPAFSLTFGNFNYNYNPDIKNLGLYLFRGTVYPGFLVSGFMDPAVDDTKGDILGLKAHNRFGNLSNDLIFANERQFPPTFDWSLGDVLKYRPIEGVEVGAGFNLYRILSANGELTTPDNADYYSQDSIATANGGSPYDHDYTEGIIDTLRNAQGQPVIDSATLLPRLHYVPTVTYTHQGIKLMGMASFDPKKVFGFGAGLGAEDLKLYAECALIGVKNYGNVYSDRSQRIPVVVGVNLPAFKWLDVVSLEVEYYGARYRNNISKLTQRKYSDLPSPIPVSYNTYDPISSKGVDPVTGRLLKDSTDAAGNPIKVPGDVQIRGTALDIEHLTQDDWKWSLFFQKTLRQHIRFSGQIANDHFRPQPTHTLYSDLDGTGATELSSSMKDWYFMCRLGYFF